MPKTNSRFKVTWRQVLALAGLVLLVALSRLAHPFAQTVAQGYNSDASLQKGMIVAPDPKDSTKVQAATTDTADRLKGVVVDQNDAAVTLSSPNQKVFVANAGRFEVLVSNQNGPVKPDDYVGISSLAGIGMRARSDQLLVIGKAVTGFDGNSGVISTANVNSRQVSIGKVAVDIGVIRNPLATSTKTNLPSFLQSASSSIAGKSVSAPRVYLAAALIAIVGIISGSMLYAGVRSSIVSIGRNPLSRRSIMTGLAQVIVTSLIIFIAGLFGVYLLLKL